MSDVFHYVIARPWRPQDPQSNLCIYMIQGSEIHQGDLSHAQAQLTYVKFLERNSQAEHYKIDPVEIGQPL